MPAGPESTDLAQVVEVVLAVDPAERRSFVDAVGLVDDVADVAADAVVQHPFEQLVYTRANNIDDLSYQSLLFSLAWQLLNALALSEPSILVSF